MGPIQRHPPAPSTPDVSGSSVSASSHELTETPGTAAILFGRNYGVALFWLALCVALAVATPTFLTKVNLLDNVLNDTAIVGILAAGEAIVIIAAAIDLSVAPVAALAAIVAAKLLQAGVTPVAAFTAGLSVGAAAGCLNGFIVVCMKVSPLIATLGTFSSLTGLGLIITNDAAIFGPRQSGLTIIGLDRFLGVLNPVWILLGVFILCAAVMNWTVWGVRLKASGGNPQAARRAGVAVGRYVWGAFIVSGICAALGGLITLGTLSEADPTMSDSLIFDAITAVALAGVLLTGGRGSMGRVFLGALILETIDNGFTLLGISSYYQLVATGVLLVVAVWLDGFLSRAIDRRRVAGQPGPGIGPP